MNSAVFSNAITTHGLSYPRSILLLYNNGFIGHFPWITKGYRRGHVNLEKDKTHDQVATIFGLLVCHTIIIGY